MTDLSEDTDERAAPEVFADLIAAERLRQHKQWGHYHDSDHDGFEWLAILMKQIGQASDKVLRVAESGSMRLYRPDASEEILHEVMQIAAVAHAWGEQLVRWVELDRLDAKRREETPSDG